MFSSGDDTPDEATLQASNVDKLKTKTSNFFIIIIFLIKQY